MADNVTLTAAMRSNLLTLQNTTSSIGKIQNVLATGKKVNSALDDPTAFFAAQSLTNRSDDLTALLDGMGQSIQVLKAADKAITSITTLVKQMKSVAQSAKDGATGASNATIYSKELTFVEASTAGLAALGTIANTDTLDFSVNGGATVTATFAANETLSSVVSKIDALAGVAASIVAGETDGSLRIKITGEVAGQSVEITDGVGTPFAGFAFEDAAGVAVTSGVAVAAGTGAPTDRTTLEASYNDLRTQISQMVEDAGYRGTNLLNLQDLKTTFNEDGTSSYTVTGKEYSVGVVGSRLAMAAANFTSLANIETALDEIDSALTNMRADAKSFGNSLAVVQAREDFTKNIISTLQEGSDKLVLADTNEEGAKLLSLQTSQSLGINALSLAASSQQSVLQLFR